MAKTKTYLSTKRTALEIQKAYPELAALVDDWQGFYKFIQIRLRQYRLTERYSADDIVIECISRWYRRTAEQKKTVPAVAGWMRVTAYHCIQELARQEKKLLLYEPAILESTVKDNSIDSAVVENLEDEGHSYIAIAMAQLSQDDRELLELRIIQELSWDAVAKHYNAQGKKGNATALRKRGQRALEKLRNAFLKINEK